MLRRPSKFTEIVIFDNRASDARLTGTNSFNRRVEVDDGMDLPRRLVTPQT